MLIYIGAAVAVVLLALLYHYIPSRKVFFAFFLVNCTEEHTAGVNAHHCSRRKICDSDKSLSNQFFRLIKAMNTA